MFNLCQPLDDLSPVDVEYECTIPRRRGNNAMKIGRGPAEWVYHTFVAGRCERL